MEVAGQVLAYHQRFDYLQSNRSANSGDRDDWEKMSVVTASMRWFPRKTEESGGANKSARCPPQETGEP